MAIFAIFKLATLLGRLVGKVEPKPEAPKLLQKPSKRRTRWLRQRKRD
jgi:hypothetical protein